MMEPFPLPSYYFGPVSWFAALVQSREGLVHQGLTYRKQQFFSRMHIRHAQGVLPLSIPILRRGERKPLTEKGISYQEDWPRHHWRSLRFAYQHAPYFMYYSEELSTLYNLRPASLTSWHEACLKWVCTQLDIPIPAFSQAVDLLPESDRFHRQFDPSLRNQPLWFKGAVYTQVFEGFIPGLSILDLLFNLGPESRIWLKQAWNQAAWEQAPISKK